jgi:hypothetical protein
MLRDAQVRGSSLFCFFIPSTAHKGVKCGESVWWLPIINSSVQFPSD